MKQLTICILAFALGVAIGLGLSERRPSGLAVTKIDTLRIAMPAAIDSTTVRTVTARLAVAGKKPKAASAPETAPSDTDSVEAEVPIVSKEYGDSTYRAWVSGYMPALDSIRIYRPIPAPPTKPKRWHLGVSAGLTATGRGVSPYVGVGITYSFISF